MYTKYVKTKFLLALLLCLMLCLVKLSAPAAAESELNFRWILPPEFYRGNDFHNGRAWVQREKDGPWTLFDTEGNIIKEGFMARHIMQDWLFHSNTMFVPLETSSEFEWLTVGFLDDYSGNVLLEPREYEIPPIFKGGLRSKRGENGLVGYIDFQGNWVIPPVYESGHDWGDGLAAVRKDGKWGYINKNGDIVIDFQFERPALFVNGLAAMRQNSLFGLIDRNGNWLTEAIYEHFFYPWANLVGAQKDGKIGFLDANGSIVINFKFPGLDAGPFSGYASFFNGRVILLLHREGRTGERISGYGELISALFYGEKNITHTNYKWAVINEYGEIIPTEDYDYILPYHGDFTSAFRDNKWFMLDRGGKEHPLPPEFVRSEVLVGRSDDGRIFRAVFRNEEKTGYFKVRD